jgi:hypothetical protein
MRKMLIAGLLAATSLPGLAAAAQTFDSWTVDKSDGQCTAWTKTASVDGETRDGAYLSIVNVPEEDVRSSVAFVYGKDGAGKGHASAEIDGKEFELLTYDKAAFAASGAPEAQLIAAMKKSGEVAVNWTDQDGSVSRDVYSLKGFSSAKAQIDKDCR